MEVIAQVGRVDPVIENEKDEAGQSRQVSGVVAYLNVNVPPLSRSGHIMIGPVLSDSDLASMLTLGSSIKIAIAAPGGSGEQP
ncbi:hypothetical protein [Sphingomonas parapaucimobilis]|uniref:Uncharacterized protein n=1 Tax=Sphingomonas parapaucimobilis NBRC 15100 TaxID=1219049 RepID=A0A0A1W721_9SPHN|nr:hypothetical protein [Sphingomonas parapaucimobilis]GAM00704.1 hypothetical protein SP5_035_01040 [Sphingomonas parapaucimobilis NBRC 15100]